MLVYGNDEVMPSSGQSCKPRIYFIFCHYVGLFDMWHPEVMVEITCEARNSVLQTVNSIPGKT